MTQEATAEIHFHSDNTASCLTHVVSTDIEAVADELLLWASFANHQMNNMGRDSHTLAELLIQVPGGLEALAGHDGDGPSLLDHHPGPAKKRIIAVWKPNVGKFVVNLKGFGLLGKGLGFYVPTSVVLLLRHLAKKRINDPIYIGCLENTAKLCGKYSLEGRLTMRNVGALATGIVAMSVESVPDDYSPP